MSLFIKTGGEPHTLLANDLSTWIQSTESKTVACLCAGGSALKIFDAITDEVVKRRTIFMMGDERVSREPSINNYDQLKARLGATFESFTVINTSFYDEDGQVYVARLNSQVKTFLEKKYPIINILGIGEDGHTAGIFPLSKESFEKQYRDKGIYVPVHIEGLTIDSRASLTPSFITNHAQAIFVYAAGEKKRAVIERLKGAREDTSIHELPASIVLRHPHATLYTDISLA